MSLRPYQIAAIESARSRYRDGQRAVLVQMATGTGKTILFAEAAKLCKGRVIIVNERQTLVEQTARAVERWCGEPVGIEMADARSLTSGGAQGPRIVAASVQTLAKRLSKIRRDWPTLVVVDEAHHATARTYRSIIDHFDRSRVFGVTATPDRSDDEFLGQVFQSLAFEYSIRDAIRDKWLVPVKTIGVRTQIDLSTVRTTAGDLNAGDLDEIMRKEAALAQIAGPLVEHAQARPSIVFSVSVEHAHDLARAINAVAGSPSYAMAIDGSFSRADREEFLRRAARGDIRCIVNCALFTEGFDHPPIEVVAMARPTKSRALYTQMVGRGTRLSPETGKTSCLVLDFTSNSKRHRLVRAYDIFNGEISEDALQIIEAVIEEADGPIDVEAALALSDERIRRRAQEARYEAIEIDTMIAPHVDRDDASDITGDQRRRLLALGVEPKTVDMLYGGTAARFLAALESRAERGLATAPQCRLLARYGIDSANVTKAQATQIIASARAGGWRPSAVRSAAASLTGKG